MLAGSDLTLRKGSVNDPELPSLSLLESTRSVVNGVPQTIPTTSAERADFSWVADLEEICQNGCDIDEAMLEAEPPAGVIAARFKLQTGNFFTFSIARIGSDITPVNFKRLDNTGSNSPIHRPSPLGRRRHRGLGQQHRDVEEKSTAIRAVHDPFPRPGRDGRDRRLNLPPFTPPPRRTVPLPASASTSRCIRSDGEPACSGSAPRAARRSTVAGAPGVPKSVALDSPSGTLWVRARTAPSRFCRTVAEQALCRRRETNFPNRGRQPAIVRWRAALFPSATARKEDEMSRTAARSIAISWQILLTHHHLRIESHEVPAEAYSSDGRIAAATRSPGVMRNRASPLDIHADAAGTDFDVLFVRPPSFLEESMIEAMHYGAGTYDIYDGGVQHFCREQTFRGVAYKDASDRVWTYGAVSVPETEGMTACRKGFL